jgi:hypothetical protein
VILLIAALGTTTPAVRAQSVPTTPTSADPRAQAQPVFNRGLALVQEQRWSEALEAFLEAHRIYPSPILLFNIGYCQRALGDYVAALRTLREFLSGPVTGAAATRRAEAEGYVRELEARIARLELQLPTELRAGAEVMLDGRALTLDAEGRAVQPLDPGRHTVQVRHGGYRPLFLDRDVQPGERVHLDVQLQRLPARLVVSSNVPTALVRLDGQSIGRTPIDLEAEPGRHELEVRAPGHVPHRSLINLEPGGAARVTADLAREPVALTRQWWFWGGLGVLVAGAAAVTYVVARPEPLPPPYEGGNLGVVLGP